MSSPRSSVPTRSVNTTTKSTTRICASKSTTSSISPLTISSTRPCRSRSATTPSTRRWPTSSRSTTLLTPTSPRRTSRRSTLRLPATGATCCAMPCAAASSTRACVWMAVRPMRSVLSGARSARCPCPTDRLSSSAVRPCRWLLLPSAPSSMRSSTTVW